MVVYDRDDGAVEVRRIEGGKDACRVRSCGLAEIMIACMIAFGI